jgi:hypothetical protein
MALLPPGTASGTTVNHNDLAGRSAVNAHPITSITGLSDVLAGQDAKLTATQPLRYIFNFSSTTFQDVMLPTPLDTFSVSVMVVRTSDGAVIEPEIVCIYSGGLGYIARIRLSFTPAVSGQFIVHVVR